MSERPSTSAPPGLPRRPARPAASRAATADPIDLAALAAAADPTDERPCPTCARPAPAPAVEDAGVDAYTCAACGRHWRVRPDDPWPDVVVDPAALVA